ncbi:MAG: hypothetical protein VX323_04330, partial [Pseudomonadota bacterium]|nr:hypothetical protein [Pseudomonadota bacterium]
SGGRGAGRRLGALACGEPGPPLAAAGVGGWGSRSPRGRPGPAPGDGLPDPATPAAASGGAGSPQASAPSRRPAPVPPEQPRGGQGGSGNVPEDTPTTGPAGPVEVPEEFADASDDDVIARQLREAAMAEQDPALRDKLWEEYRRYKANGA